VAQAAFEVTGTLGYTLRLSRANGSSAARKSSQPRHPQPAQLQRIAQDEGVSLASRWQFPSPVRQAVPPHRPFPASDQLRADDDAEIVRVEL